MPHTTVQKTVKNELKSWSDVVKKNQTSQVNSTKKSVKEVIEEVHEEDRRACNVMVYGLEEGAEDEAGLVFLMADLTLEVDCNGVECNDIYRVGKREEGKTRPIRVECKTRSDVQFLLSNARKLKKTEKFCKVYLAPDRTREQKVAHNKLVNEMKEKIAADPSK